MWWKGFPVGHFFLFLWVCFWLRKAALGHLFPLPFGASSLIPLGLIFPRIGKKCAVSCRSVFGSKQHWDRFFFLPWDRMPFESIGTSFFAPVVLFLPKSNTGKRCSCGCVFLAWSSTGQGVKLRRSQVERARSLQDEKNWRTAGENIWQFRTTDIKVRRFGHMRLCDWEGVRGWRWENLQMGRGQNFILKENERVRPRGRIESVWSRIHIERWLSAKNCYIFKKIKRKTI